MSKRLLLLLPVAILMVQVQGLRLVAACGGASRATRVLHKKVGKIQLHYDSARGVLYSLAETANVVIGVEEVESPSKSVFFEFPGGTVRQLLDSFVSQFPAYQWREDKGIIHVFWHGTHLPIADVAISYPGAHGKTLGQMRSDIPDIPEIKAWLHSHHCSHDQGLANYTIGPLAQPFSVDGGSMTLAQLLDQVATKSGQNYWSIVQTPPGEPCDVDISIE